MKSLRVSFVITDAPKWVSGAFIERIGNQVYLGIIKRNGDDYAWTQITTDEFKETYETIMKGVK